MVSSQNLLNSKKYTVLKLNISMITGNIKLNNVTSELHWPNKRKSPDDCHMCGYLLIFY